MISYGQRVSHEWERRNMLRRLSAGHVRRDEVCDADFLLITASKFHGEPAPRACPVCDGGMRTVRWIYGDGLGHRSGTARTEDEIDRIAREFGPITVHLVEVCPRCRWNHLLEESVAIWEAERTVAADEQGNRR